MGNSKCEYKNCWAYRLCNNCKIENCEQKKYYKDFNPEDIEAELSGLNNLQEVVYIGDVYTDNGLVRMYNVITDLEDPNSESFIDNLRFDAVVIQYVASERAGEIIEVYNEPEDIAYWLGIHSIKHILNTDKYNELIGE